MRNRRIRFSTISDWKKKKWINWCCLKMRSSLRCTEGTHIYVFAAVLMLYHTNASNYGVLSTTHVYDAFYYYFTFSEWDSLLFQIKENIHCCWYDCLLIYHFFPYLIESTIIFFSYWKLDGFDIIRRGLKVNLFKINHFNIL